MFQPKKELFGAVLSALPKACAGLLQAELRSRGCSARGTSAVFTGWPSYYIKIMKGIVPGLWLN